MKTKALIILALALTSCATPNKPHWTTGGNNATHPVLPSQVYPDRFYKHLAVVELDEQGDLWSERQLSLARQMIDAAPKRPMLVLYIHGWQNNSDPKNGDLATFNQLLDKLSKTPSVANNFTVCGVFIGWRGASFKKEYDFTLFNWIARQGSFWSRKAATDRMAGVPLTGAISKLVSSARNNSAGRGISVLIGHSFGGRILERTFGQSLVSQYAFSNDKTKAFLPADLTILINPASEALYARQIKLAMRGWSDPRPAVISITAESDSATGLAWPAGTAMASIFGGFRKYALGGGNAPESQRSYVMQTAGHDTRMPTHKLVRVGVDSKITRDNAFSFNLTSGSRDQFYITQKNGAVKFSLREINPQREGKARHLLPVGGYWVLNVPDTILKGHGGLIQQGGIFSDQVMDLLAALFKITNTKNVTTTPTVKLSETPSAALQSEPVVQN